MNIFIKINLYFLIFFSFFVFLSGQAKADDYYAQGVMISNPLIGETVAMVNSFEINSSIPAGTSIKVQFSVDGNRWYDDDVVRNSWISLNNGTTTIDISKNCFSGSNFLYRLLFETTDASSTPSVSEVIIDFSETEYNCVYAGENAGEYYDSGAILSVNVLAGQTVSQITSVEIDVNIPASTTAGFQFSLDGSNWFGENNKAEQRGAFATLVNGTNTINLVSSCLSGPNFYYRLLLETSDASSTPVISEVRINYQETGTSCQGSIYVLEGYFVSTDLLVDSGSPLTGSEKFAYSISSLPADSSAKVQFSKDNTTWYNAAGVSGNYDVLSFGDHLGPETAISLDFDFWRGSESFYYKMVLNSVDGEFSPIIKMAGLVSYTASMGSGVKNAPPIAHYKFDEGYGATVHDESGNGYHGTASSSSSGTNTTVSQMWSLDGKYNRAMEFDGTDDFVDIGNVGNIKTISFWVKASTTTEKIVRLSLIPWACGDSVLNENDGITYSTVLADDGNCWLASNLGTVNIATAYNDSSAYGAYYQWGRLTDGHQISTSGTTATLSSSDTPGHANFITYDPSPYDWRSPQNNNLWQGVDGINNPCPSGWRLPTQSEWSTVVTAEGITNYTTAVSSNLKLSAAGYRYRSNGLFYSQGSRGHYWSSSPNGINAHDLYFTSTLVDPSYLDSRAFGLPVRCLGSSNPESLIEILNGTILASSLSSPTIYVDGKISSTIDTNWHHVVITTDTDIAASIFAIGKAGSSYFDGLIDELKIFNYALTADDVKQEYNQGSAVVFGSSGTDASGNSDNSTNRKYCVPGDIATCNPPVGEWKFEKKSGNISFDTSGKGNDGTNFNTVSAIGKVGNALKFNGANSYIGVGDTSQNINTISFWIKPNTNSESIIDLDGGTRTISSSAGTISAGGFSAPTIYVSGTQSSSLNTSWQHITITTATPINVANLSIGKIASNYFDGIIDEVRIYNYVRTPIQISYEYNKGAPIAHWDFGKGEGLIAHDQNANNNPGTISGATWQTSGCISNNCLSFDGTNDSISVGDTNLNINSISFWIKTSYDLNYFLDLDGGTRTISLSNSQIQTTGLSSPTIYVDGTQSSTIPDNAWHQITIVTNTAVDVNNLTIGKIGIDYYTGLFDEIKLYNYPLTTEQVKTNYSGGAVNFGGGG